MARDQSGTATLSASERQAGKRAGRKRVGGDGHPQERSSVEMQDAADRTKTTVRDSLKLGPQES